MSCPIVSVIIPTYAGARHLGEAIQSVLDQTYVSLELIVVNDVSPDDTDQVVRRFSDHRLKYLVHDENRGAVAARQTGLNASVGEIVAFLDQDDLFHRDKLQIHIDFLNRHQDIGVSYNGRFEVEAETKAIRSIWQPPPEASLADLVLGFPFSPSDTVLRRDLALRPEIWDQSYVHQDGEMIFNGAEIVLGGRLALGGVRFASVGRALTYRRYHPRRSFKGLSGRCQAERRCQEIILDDPRCPAAVTARRGEAFTNTYLVWAYYAFAQGDTGTGQSFLREAVTLTPSLVKGELCGLVEFMMLNTASDWSVDLATQLHGILEQFPPEHLSLATQFDRALAQAYLTRGVQAILFNRADDSGEQYLTQAATAGAIIDELFVQKLTHQLMGHRTEFGGEATHRAVEKLVPYLERIERPSGRRLKGAYAVNVAFHDFRSGNYAEVPGEVVRAITNDPKYLFNRGVLSILWRSATGSGNLSQRG